MKNNEEAKTVPVLKFSRFFSAEDEQKPPESQINAQFFGPGSQSDPLRGDDTQNKNAPAEGEKSTKSPDAVLDLLYAHARAAERIYRAAEKDKKVR